jgi:anti-sigma factor RsiW
MNTERTPLNDKELWRSLAAARDDVPEAVSDLDFAAWLEGRLPETAAARVEAAVAADPEMRRAALELADILGKPLPAPPARLEVRAKALVGFEVERRTKRVGLFDWLFASDRRFAMQRAVALTAALAIAVSGFMLGGGLGASVAEERFAMNTPQTTSTDNSNELTEFLVSDGI